MFLADADDEYQGELWIPGSQHILKLRWRGSSCAGPGDWEVAGRISLPPDVFALGSLITENRYCHVVLGHIRNRLLETCRIRADDWVESGRWDEKLDPDTKWERHWSPDFLTARWLNHLVSDGEKLWWIGRSGPGRYGHGSTTIPMHERDDGWALSFDLLGADRRSRHWQIRRQLEFHTFRPAAKPAAVAPAGSNSLVAWAGTSLRRWNIDANGAIHDGESLIDENDLHLGAGSEDALGPVCPTPTGVATFIRTSNESLRWIFLDLESTL